MVRHEEKTRHWSFQFPESSRLVENHRSASTPKGLPLDSLAFHRETRHSTRTGTRPPQNAQESPRQAGMRMRQTVIRSRSRPDRPAGLAPEPQLTLPCSPLPETRHERREARGERRAARAVRGCRLRRPLRPLTRTSRTRTASGSRGGTEPPRHRPAVPDAPRLQARVPRAAVRKLRLYSQGLASATPCCPETTSGWKVSFRFPAAAQAFARGLVSAPGGHPAAAWRAGAETPAPPCASRGRARHRDPGSGPRPCPLFPGARPRHLPRLPEKIPEKKLRSNPGEGRPGGEEPLLKECRD